MVEERATMGERGKDVAKPWFFALFLFCVLFFCFAFLIFYRGSMLAEAVGGATG